MKQLSQKRVTANDLLSGDVIYLGENKQWVFDIEDAQVFEDADHAEAALQENNDPSFVVGAYTFDVDKAGDPKHFREDFRATGPSNYFHGKQAQA